MEQNIKKKGEPVCKIHTPQKKKTRTWKKGTTLYYRHHDHSLNHYLERILYGRPVGGSEHINGGRDSDAQSMHPPDQKDL